MRKFLLYWGPVFIWMLVIFLFSSRSRVSVSDEYTLNFIFFKTLHVIEYFTLMVLSYRAVRNTISPAWGWIGYIVSVVYALSDEYHQLFVKTREGTIRDVIIDASGALLAWIVIVRLLPGAPAKLKKLAVRLRIIS